jgi:hypothetical protein
VSGGSHRIEKANAGKTNKQQKAMHKKQRVKKIKTMQKNNNA